MLFCFEYVQNADGNNQPLALLNIHLPIMMLAIAHGPLLPAFPPELLVLFSTILAEQSGFTD